MSRTLMYVYVCVHIYSGSQKKLASSRESHAQLNANAQMFSIFAMGIRACKHSRIIREKLTKICIDNVLYYVNTVNIRNIIV